jgi:carbonic anhydrase/acetyltransferase-like protein (isoleucine patch superfamily)
VDAACSVAVSRCTPPPSRLNHVSQSLPVALGESPTPEILQTSASTHDDVRHSLVDVSTGGLWAPRHALAETERPGNQLIAGLVSRFRLRACHTVGRGVRVYGRLWIHGDGDVLIGDRVTLDASAAPIELYPWAGATIVIGSDSFIGGGTSIEATSSITLGERTRLDGFCRIMDNHFHPLVGNRHLRPAPRAVVIEDDTSIGPRSIVMAGVHLARGSRFGAGSVIKRSTRVARHARH